MSVSRVNRAKSIAIVYRVMREGAFELRTVHYGVNSYIKNEPFGLLISIPNSINFNTHPLFCRSVGGGVQGNLKISRTAYIN